MDQLLNSSYCRDRCFDRGLCYVLENENHCLCRQPSAYDDCRDDNITTTATTTITIRPFELSTQTKILCGIVAVVFLGLALVTLNLWQQMSTTWRSSKVDQARGKSIFFLQHRV
ncbi:unnamed protein product [Cylicocyclus nassatus]|uniref:Uncharacterized protein n=1 Tax=Cylicocyclus nassatus TaxID=53992 RepID=A0AA36GWY0_CYLNA|nr:unnamed protein product [Cylicocyclus nassatus]